MDPDPLVHQLRERLGDGGVLTPFEDLTRYEQGWRYGLGMARCVARPKDTAEVQFVLQACKQFGARVVAQGANTGLVAASTPDPSGTMVVLTSERMDHTIELDIHNRTVLVSAGVRLSQLNGHLQPHGLGFPIDLGADPQLGGMIATNTGGTRLLRHGDVRRHVLGLEVVLGDGSVVSALNRLRKNNTGLDSKQLFVGTTGVFGVITRAVLQVSPLPRQRVAALVGCADGAEVLALLASLERDLGDLLSAFEVMSRAALQPVFVHQPDLRSPFGSALPAYSVLVELATTLLPAQLALDELLTGALTSHADTAFVGEPEPYWRIRHSISESLRREGRALAFDLAVPRSQLPAFTATATAWLARTWPFVRLCDYGHWGDGGTHVVLVWRDADAGRSVTEMIAALQPCLYDLAVRDFGGSYSAEHGIGPHNQKTFDRYAEPAVRALAAAIKQHCDPDDRLGTTRLW